MPFSSPNVWASSYEEKMNTLFGDAAQPGFSADAKTEQAWQEWFDENVIEAACIAPIAGAPQITATKSPSNFAPVQFVNPGTPDLAALVLSSAFAAYMSSLVWTVPPPAPPFSAIVSVVTDPASLAAAQATLYAALIAEFAIIPPPGGEQAKYTAIGTLFFTAASTVQVLFTGLGIGSPPPPLVILVPMI